MTIQQRIFKIMQEKHITQSELSKSTGIPQPTISDWKNKNKMPSSDKIIAIAKCLEVSVSYLLGVDEISSEENNIVMHGNNFAAGIIKDSTVNTDMFGNKDVSEAYNKLSPTEKLEIQIEILKKADSHEGR